MDTIELKQEPAQLEYNSADNTIQIKVIILFPACTIQLKHNSSKYRLGCLESEIFCLKFLHLF